MSKEYDISIILAGMKAKKPRRIFFFCFCIILTIVLINNNSDDSLKKFILICSVKPIVILIFIVSFPFLLYFYYLAFIDGILDVIDAIFNRQVMFTGQVIASTDFHVYYGDVRMGSGWVVKINGKKKILYEYYPLYESSKIRNKKLYTKVDSSDEVNGIYLKHSKLILEMDRINQPVEIEKSIKRRKNLHIKK